MQTMAEFVRLAVTPLALMLSLVAVSCAAGDGDPRAAAPGSSAVAATPSSSTSATPSSTSATPPTRPPIPKVAPPTRGTASSGCVDGWETPARGDPRRDVPWRVIRAETGWRGTFVVVDMRYFTGPESPPEPDKGYLRVVQRWYVKGFVREDPALQGRFLVERRRFGSGVSAVAPYDTRGWASPDWTGFQLDTADPTPRTYPGLPGRWSGIPYDFVDGGGGLRIPGLPAEVTGCLDGT
jgi:hypothetical protein